MQSTAYLIIRVCLPALVVFTCLSRSASGSLIVRFDHSGNVSHEEWMAWRDGTGRVHDSVSVSEEAQFGMG